MMAVRRLKSDIEEENTDLKTKLAQAEADLAQAEADLAAAREAIEQRDLLVKQLEEEGVQAAADKKRQHESHQAYVRQVLAEKGELGDVIAQQLLMVLGMLGHEHPGSTIITTKSALDRLKLGPAKPMSPASEAAE